MALLCVLTFLLYEWGARIPRPVWRDPALARKG